MRRRQRVGKAQRQTHHLAEVALFRRCVDNIEHSTSALRPGLKTAADHHPHYRLLANMKEDSERDYPPAFICPITQELMRDPVTAADGHSYERTAIEQWLASSDLSPLTGQRLPHKQLTRSHALRNAIEEEHAAVAARRRQQAALKNVPAAPTGVKVILLGDSAVGKSSLVHRVKEGSFSASASQPTIGCSFCTHTVTSPNQSFAPVNLAIWDTAGQEKYRAFTRQYFRGAQAAVLLYDITSASSLTGAKAWLAELQAELPPTTVLVLVGAKLDRAEEREVPIASARQLAASARADHLECSSKDGTNCDAVFERVAKRLLERGLGRGVPGLSSDRLHGAPMISVVPQGRAGGCCQG